MYTHRPIRLKDFSYTRSGYYFITICTEGRVHRFGEIKNGMIHLDQAGIMVKKWFGILGEHFPSVYVDLFVIMPDHIHCILKIINSPSPSPDTTEPSWKEPSVMDIVGWLKTMTTNEYIRGVKAGLFPRFEKRLWQQRFYDRVIPHWDALQQTRAYIFNNPMNWEHDHQDEL